jgi:hypothetical protein
MCRAVVIHNIDDIYEDCNRPGAFPLPPRDPLGSFVFARDLISSDLRAPHSRPPRRRGLKLMGSLRAAAQFAIESLRGLGLKNVSSKETIMLDVAFVALGLAALALMGVYALALRQL